MREGGGDRNGRGGADVKTARRKWGGTEVIEEPMTSLYCPRCQRLCPRSQWRHVWRHLKNGVVDGTPAEVLRHRLCDEIVYVVLE